MLNRKLLRAARCLLDWNQDDLANAAGVAAPTIQRMESLGPERSTLAKVNKVRAALEDGGVVFIPENGGGPGVRLRHPLTTRPGREEAET